MALNFFKIQQSKDFEEKIKQANIATEVLAALGVENNFAGLPLEYYSKGNSSVTISPERGATIPLLILDGKNIFYNNPERRNNPFTKPREGHRMGPQPGTFTKEQMSEYGYKLERHGFLRDEKWETLGVVKDEIRHIFRSNSNTFGQFPHKFNSTQKIKLGHNTVEIGLDTQNTGGNPMHFLPGYHSYLRVDSYQKKNIKFDDNLQITHEMRDKLINKEEAITVTNPGISNIWIPGTGELELSFGPKFKKIVFRSEKDQGSLSIEPIVDKTSNRLQSDILTHPREIMHVGFSIKLITKDNH